MRPEDERVARLTTVGTGGPARWYAAADTREHLEQALAWAGSEHVSVAVVGLGSNLLAADSGYDGLVVKLVDELAAVVRDGDCIECGGGAPLAVIVRRSREWELSGIEFGCAIPGTAGGAVRMNAGAYGSDWSAILVRALVATADGSCPPPSGATGGRTTR